MFDRYSSNAFFYHKTVISIVRFDSDKNAMCGMWAQHKWQTHGKTIKHNEKNTRLDKYFLVIGFAFMFIDNVAI